MLTENPSFSKPLHTEAPMNWRDVFALRWARGVLLALGLCAASSRASASVLFEITVQADHRTWNTVLDSRSYSGAAESGNWSFDLDCVNPAHPHFDGQITSEGAFGNGSLTFGSRTEYLWNPPGFDLGWPWLKTQYNITMWTTAPEGSVATIHSRTTGSQVNENLNTGTFGLGPWYWSVGSYVYQAPRDQNMTFDESHVESSWVTGTSRVFGSTLYRKINATAVGISELEQNGSVAGGPHYGLIDVDTTLSVSVVPEPSTFAAFVIALPFLRRFRKKESRA